MVMSNVLCSYGVSYLILLGSSLLQHSLFFFQRVCHELMCESTGLLSRCMQNEEFLQVLGHTQAHVHMVLNRI